MRELCAHAGRPIRDLARPCVREWWVYIHTMTTTATTKRPETKEEWTAFQKAAEERWAAKQALPAYLRAEPRCHADPCINTYDTIKALWK